MNNVEGFLILVFLSFLFLTVSERVRFSTGKEMLIDKLIRFLEEIHRRTAPKIFTFFLR